MGWSLAGGSWRGLFHGEEGRTMAKRRYYSFEKRQKELKREKKNEAKLGRRRLKKATAAGGEPLEEREDAVEGESEPEPDHAEIPEPA